MNPSSHYLQPCVVTHGGEHVQGSLLKIELDIVRHSESLGIMTSFQQGEIRNLQDYFIFALDMCHIHLVFDVKIRLH
jgi:hypothetical protein